MDQMLKLLQMTYPISAYIKIDQGRQKTELYERGKNMISMTIKRGSWEGGKEKEE
jgi:hypothetical protein